MGPRDARRAARPLGGGLGSAVLADALALVAKRAAGAAVSLETSDPRNVRLYERHGFAVTAHTAVPDGPDVFSMLREPGH